VITSENLFSHEIIGLSVRTFDSGPYSDLSGQIVKETRNMITIGRGRILKNLPKNSINIRIILPSGACFISGNSLIGRPEDRVVKKGLR
jgi:RNase P/RNase MRP subunit p29